MLDSRIDGNLDIRKFGYAEIRIFGYPDIRKSGYPEIGISGKPHIRKSGYVSSCSGFSGAPYPIFRLPDKDKSGKASLTELKQVRVLGYSDCLLYTSDAADE